MRRKKLPLTETQQHATTIFRWLYKYLDINNQCPDCGEYFDGDDHKNCALKPALMWLDTVIAGKDQTP